MMKKIVSLLLVLAVVLSMALPAGAAFSDIPDAQTQRDVAVLEMMGVINGTSATSFSPNGTLTRAQFCKMAVVLMGRADEEPLYRTRTIFPDVRSDHWARGYVNLAVSITIGAAEDGTGGTQLIRGMGDGTFRPDRSITFAEAVTILLRILGYTDADAGMNWPKGYLELAAKIGLTEGMNLSANQSLSRGQAAHLFATLLTTNQKNGSPYYNQIGTKVDTNVVLMSCNATASDGTSGAILTSASSTPIKTVSGIAPTELAGSRGALVTDESGRAVAFVPVGVQKVVTVSVAEASWLTDQNGNRYEISTDAPAYTTTESSTYGKMWMDLRSGRQITLFCSDSGKVESLFMSTASAENAMVARSLGGGNPFASLLGGATDYTIYRDGSPATVKDICLYDVGTYDPATHILSVSSTKLTGKYENAWPNLKNPLKVTVLGNELPVMSMAVSDMAKFTLGETVTLLLTSDGQVAGAVSTNAARSENIGIRQADADGKVVVTLLNGMRVSGECSSTESSVGELVRVTSAGAGQIRVSRVTGSGSSGAFSLLDRRLGATQVSSSCRYFEKVGNGPVQQISLDDVTVQSVSGSNIIYTHKNTAGAIDVMIFENVTGDCFTYGIADKKKADIEGGEYNNTVKVINSAGSTAEVECNQKIDNGDMIGIVVTVVDGKNEMVDFVKLEEETNIGRSDFTTRDGKTYVTMETQEMRVSDDVQCYNRLTGFWFDSLEDCRAFSDNLTVYYDRPASEGGKIRVVVAE